MYKISEIEKKKKRTLNIIKAINILLCIIIIPILIYNIALIFKYIKNPNETPDFLGVKTFEIVSRSMGKTINKNDVIVVKEVPENEIQVNDIISFNTGKEIITHRIINIENIDGQEFYTTKGDNNRFKDDEKIIYEQIEGKYVFKFSGLGYFMNFLKNKYVLTILFIILIFFLIHIIKVKKRVKNREEKRKDFKKSC